MKLLVFDVDGTLYPRIASTSVRDFNAKVTGSNPAPVPGAVATVQRLRFSHPRAVCLVLTGRDTSLLTDTSRWVTRNFALLRQAAISMRASERVVHTDDLKEWKQALLTAYQDKVDRLAALRQKFPGPMTLVDDDEGMRESIRPGDHFIHAPHQLDQPLAGVRRRW